MVRATFEATYIPTLAIRPCTTLTAGGHFHGWSCSWLNLRMDSDVWKSELFVFVSAKNANMDIRIRIRIECGWQMESIRIRLLNPDPDPDIRISVGSGSE